LFADGQISNLVGELGSTFSALKSALTEEKEGKALDADETSTLTSSFAMLCKFHLHAQAFVVSTNAEAEEYADEDEEVELLQDLGFFSLDNSSSSVTLFGAMEFVPLALSTVLASSSAASKGKTTKRASKRKQASEASKAGVSFSTITFLSKFVTELLTVGGLIFSNDEFVTSLMSTVRSWVMDTKSSLEAPLSPATKEFLQTWTSIMFKFLFQASLQLPQAANTLFERTFITLADIAPASVVINTFGLPVDCVLTSLFSSSVLAAETWSLQCAQHVGGDHSGR